jgi:hypothetical protein
VLSVPFTAKGPAAYSAARPAHADGVWQSRRRHAPRQRQRARALFGSVPHLRRDWVHPAHICTGTGLTPATSASGLGPTRPHLHQDWVHASHICTRTGSTPPTSAPGLGWVHQLLERARAQVVLHERVLHERLVPAAEQRRARCSSSRADRSILCRCGRKGGAHFCRPSTCDSSCASSFLNDASSSACADSAGASRAHICRAQPRNLDAAGPFQAQPQCGRSGFSPGADGGAQSGRRCGKSTEARTRTSSQPRGASVCERLRALNQLTSWNLSGTRQPAGKRVRARTRAKGPQWAREGYGTSCEGVRIIVVRVRNIVRRGTDHRGKGTDNRG